MSDYAFPPSVFQSFQSAFSSVAALSAWAPSPPIASYFSQGVYGAPVQAQSSWFQFLSLPAQQFAHWFGLSVPTLELRMRFQKKLCKKTYTFDPRPRHFLPPRASYRTRARDLQPRQLSSASSRNSKLAARRSVRTRLHMLPRCFKIKLQQSAQIGLDIKYCALAYGCLMKRVHWEAELKAKRRAAIDDAREKRQRLISVSMEDDFASESSQSVEDQPMFSIWRVPSSRFASSRLEDETSAVMSRLAFLSRQSARPDPTPAVYPIPETSQPRQRTISAPALLHTTEASGLYAADFRVKNHPKVKAPEGPSRRVSELDFVDSWLERVSDHAAEELKEERADVEAQFHSEAKQMEAEESSPGLNRADKGKERATGGAPRAEMEPAPCPRVTVEDVSEDDDITEYSYSSESYLASPVLAPQPSQPTPPPPQSRLVHPPLPQPMPFMGTPATSSYSPTSSFGSLSSSQAQSTSSRIGKSGRRLAHWAPQRWHSPGSHNTSIYGGGFQWKRAPKRWTPEEDEEIIAKFRTKRVSLYFLLPSRP